MYYNIWFPKDNPSLLITRSLKSVTVVNQLDNFFTPRLGRMIGINAPARARQRRGRVYYNTQSAGESDLWLYQRYHIIIIIQNVKSCLVFFNNFLRFFFFFTFSWVYTIRIYIIGMESDSQIRLLNHWTRLKKISLGSRYTYYTHYVIHTHTGQTTATHGYTYLYSFSTC